MMATITTPKSVRIVVNDDALQKGVQGRSFAEKGHLDKDSSNTSFEDEGEDSRDPFCVVESIMGVNRMLEKQIEALRLRVNVEAKHHAIEKSKIIGENDSIITKKSSVIEELKEGIQQRDQTISALKVEAATRSNIIDGKSTEIEKLRELITVAEDYTKRLHRHSENFRGTRGLNKDDLAKFHKDELNKLQGELRALKHKVTALEKELSKARDLIELQGSKIGQLEDEKSGLSLKFKDQLEKASRAMRQEVERMREVMTNQWEEMRNLREQNQDIHDDVRMIRTMLVDQASPGGGTPKESSRTAQTTQLDQDLLKYKLDDHKLDMAAGVQKKEEKVHHPATVNKTRIPMNRPTVSKSPRLGMASTKALNAGRTSSNIRSSTVLSARNKAGTDANLPPIPNLPKTPTAATPADASRATRRPCGISSAKQSYSTSRRK